MSSCKPGFINGKPQNYVDPIGISTDRGVLIRLLASNSKSFDDRVLRSFIGDLVLHNGCYQQREAVQGTPSSDTCFARASKPGEPLRS